MFHYSNPKTWSWYDVKYLILNSFLKVMCYYFWIIIKHAEGLFLEYIKLHSQTSDHDWFSKIWVGRANSTSNRLYRTHTLILWQLLRKIMTDIDKMYVQNEWASTDPCFLWSFSDCSCKGLWYPLLYLVSQNMICKTDRLMEALYLHMQRTDSDKGSHAVISRNYEQNKFPWMDVCIIYMYIIQSCFIWQIICGPFENW